MEDDSKQLIRAQIRYLYEDTDFVSTVFEGLVGYAIIAANFDGKVIAYNEGARQIYGYAPQAVVGKLDFSTFFPQPFIDNVTGILSGRPHHVSSMEVERLGGLFRETAGPGTA